jgi:hypothetical protein
MTELSFLIDLLLNHELPKPTKDLIASRIREVETRLVSTPSNEWLKSPAQLPMQVTLSGPKQAPSTLALMAKHGDIPPVMPAPEMPPIEPVTQVAQTQATAAALSSRNSAIADAIAGKVDKVNGRPRKW